jgi:tape measure domain-containing protein
VEDDLTIRARLLDDVSGPAKTAKKAIEELGRETKRIQGGVAQGLIPNRSLVQTTSALGRMRSMFGSIRSGMSSLATQATALGNRMWSSIGGLASRAVSTLHNQLRTLAIGFGTAGAAAAAFGIKAAGDMEMLGIAFETILGSKAAGDQFIAQMEAFAKITPFRFNDVASAAKGMLAGGWNPDQILTDLRKMGDGAAAVGAPIGNIVAQIQQMKASESINWADLRILGNNGLPALDILASKLGMTVKDLKTTLSNPGGGAELFQKGGLDALVDGIGERYSGMMDRQSKTFMGKISNLLDAMSMGAAKIFRPLTDALKPALDWLIPKVETGMQRLTAKAASFAEKFRDGFRGVSKNESGEMRPTGGRRGVAGGMDAVFGKETTDQILEVYNALKKITTIAWAGITTAFRVIKAVIGWLSDHKDIVTDVAIAVGVLTAAMIALGAALWIASANPIVLIAAAVVVLVAAIVHLIRHNKTVQKGLTMIGHAAMAVARFFGRLASTVMRLWRGSAVFRAIAIAIGMIAAPIVVVIGVLWRFRAAIVNAFKAAAHWIHDAWNKTRGFREAVGRISQAAVRGVARAFASVWNWIKKAAGVIGDFVGWIKKISQGPVRGVARAFASVWNMVKKAVSAVQSLIRWIKNIPDKVVNIAMNIPGAGVAKKVGGWLNPFGDTSSPRVRGRGGSYGASVGMRHALGGGGLTVTSGVRNFALGSHNSAHRTGRAEDLVGSGLPRFAARLNAAGGFAEFHGSGEGRHLHSEYPVGDTSAPRVRGGGGSVSYGGDTFNIVGSGLSQAELEAAIHGVVARRDRQRAERSSRR